MTDENVLTLAEAIKALKLVISIEAVTEKHLILERPIPFGKDSNISKLELAEISSALRDVNFNIDSGDACIKLDQSCEFLLIRNTVGPARLPLRDLEEGSHSNESELSYSMGKPSLSFYLKYLGCALKLIRGGETKNVPSNIVAMRQRIRDWRIYATIGESSTQPPSLSEILGEIGFMITLKIKSAKPRTEFKETAESYLFGLAYNYDVSYRIASDLDHLFGGRARRRGRSADAIMDAPRMTYNTDLVHHYQLAVSADSPMLQYLSYYHIAEHFFEKVFNEDFVEQVRRKIADPSFSLRRNKDIQGIIKLVNANQRRVRDEGGVDEQRALSLVLERYVDLPRLVDDINAHDESLILHYRTESPSFSENIPVDLEAPKESDVKNSLARRIYQVRNSLVHAKEGSRPKYFPFVNDAELRKEVPLLRFCSEQIIIAHGKVV